MSKKRLRELGEALKDGAMTLDEYDSAIAGYRAKNREKQRAYRQRIRESRTTGQGNSLRRIEVIVPDIVAVLMNALSSGTGITQRVLIELALIQFTARHANIAAVDYASADVKKLAGTSDDTPRVEAYGKIMGVKLPRTESKA